MKSWDAVLRAKLMLESRTCDRSEPVEPHVELEVHTRARYTSICLKTLRGLFDFFNDAADEVDSLPCPSGLSAADEESFRRLEPPVTLADRLLGLRNWAEVVYQADSVSFRFMYDIYAELVTDEDAAYAQAIEEAAELVMLITATEAARRMADAVTAAVMSEAEILRLRCQRLPDISFDGVWMGEVVPRLVEVVMNQAAAAAEAGKPPLVLKDSAMKPIRDVARLDYRNGLRTKIWDECCRRQFLHFFNDDSAKRAKLDEIGRRQSLV